MLGKHKNTWTEFIAGDQQAMLMIYEQHYLGLINFGIKISGSRSVANECITEMLIDLWDKRHRLPEIENVRSYLLTCLKRKIYNHFKTEKIRLNKEIEFQLLGTNELTFEDYFSRIQSNSVLKGKLVQVMEKLSFREKELIKLKFFEDLDYDEIAQKCNITKRTAYNIIHAALKKMREELNDNRSGISHEFFVEFLILVLLYMSYDTSFPHYIN